MVTKWLKSKKDNKRSMLHREHPPIKVKPNSFGIVPPNLFATISIFQSFKDESLCINHFGSSHNGNKVHLALLSPSLAYKAAVACRQITQDCWHQQLRQHPEWINSSSALADWLEKVQQSLVDFGGGSIATALQGVTLDHEAHKAHFYLSGLAGAILVSQDGEIKHITASRGNGLLGSPSSRPPVAQSISTKSLAAIVLASDDYQQNDIERGIQKIRSIPYPKSGAAELLFFELQKKSIGSSILWIEF